jgi:hypothetical protein
MFRRKLLRSAAAAGVATLGGCIFSGGHPLSVESVQTTTTGESETDILTVVILRLDTDVDTYEVPVEVKIEKRGEKVAYSWIKEEIITSTVEFPVFFPIAEVDGSIPIRPDEYDAFGRVGGEEWQKAKHVDNINI